ncbi:hypothetical protein MFLAVUS_007801 [Mucor flavus]|uniref:Secreted protein n=1 Tax=Mucor flavus TaxID=439312 RepID=A0ABP9Z5C6_9FUNG
MKTTIISTTIAFIACLQTVSAAYWTVRYRNEPFQNGRYAAEYEYWGTNLTYGEDFGRTVLACSYSASHLNKAFLLNSVPEAYWGCGEPNKEPRFSPMVSAVGSDTELYALAVQFDVDVPCALIEYGTGYKTYICSENMPVVNKPSVVDNTTVSTRTDSITFSTTLAQTATATQETTSQETTSQVTTAQETTTQKTTTSKPTATDAPCKAGYRGKRNGKGPNGACCSHSDDCLDTCVSGICGVSP